MTAFLIVIYSICGIYLLLNLKHDVHMLQQNSYRLPRYWRYLSKTDIGSAWRLTDVAMLFVACSRLLDFRLVLFLTGLLSIYKISSILKKRHKKPLVFTKRVWRIYSVAGGISIGLYLWAVFMFGFKSEAWSFYSGPIITISILLLLAVFSWVCVMVSVIVLTPVERIINKKFWNEASGIIKSMPDLKVIGITGSYGKTSTKHFLERILSEKYDVSMTPGSFNTTMGVIRTIREYLKPYNNIFICEMGAKQKGDIKEICDLVHPQIGIITAVGPMHLETFKTIENIQSAKFELIDSLPPDGLAVVNDDFEYCSKRHVSNVECMRYTTLKDGAEGKNYRCNAISYSPQGTSFTIECNDGWQSSFTTKVLGECNVSNLMAAIIVARHLGLSDTELSRGVASVSPVEHRLSINHTVTGVTIIDDAFNSNPEGSRMALDVLKQFGQGKRFVVTPGMVELGDRQFELNEKFGRLIAESCDIAIIVGHYNRDAITTGISANNFKGKLYETDTFDEAQRLLAPMLQSGDTVLYENDLPDSFK